MAATLITKEDGTKTHVGLYSCETNNELNKVCNINANVFVVVATGEMSSLLHGGLWVNTYMMTASLVAYFVSRPML